MAEDNQPERIPANPQEFLSMMEFLTATRGRTINLETHGLLMYLIAEAVVAVEPQPTPPLYCMAILARLQEGLEVLHTGLPAMDGDSLQQEVQLFEYMVEQWLRHYQARASDTSDTEP